MCPPVHSVHRAERAEIACDPCQATAQATAQVVGNGLVEGVPDRGLGTASRGPGRRIVGRRGPRPEEECGGPTPAVRADVAVSVPFVLKVGTFGTAVGGANAPRLSHGRPGFLDQCACTDQPVAGFLCIRGVVGPCARHVADKDVISIMNGVGR